MLVTNRPLSLREQGKIKIGAKGAPRKSQGGGTFQPPTKLDHFLITSMEKGDDDNFLPDVPLMETIAEATGQDPKSLPRIPVCRLFDEIELNFQGRYAAYRGKTVWCTGDGQVARRLTENIAYAQHPCPCERIERDFKPKDRDDPMCKINASLSVLIDGAPGLGGTWKFRTTSFNSHDALFGSLMFIHRAAGGRIAGIPLELVLTAKKVADPSGKQQTIYVVGLEFAGTMENLRESTLQIASDQARAGLQIAKIETEARRLLAAPDGKVFADDDVEGVADEFFPEGEEPPAIEDPGAQRKETGKGKGKKDPAPPQEQTDGPEQNSQGGAPPQLQPPDGASAPPIEAYEEEPL